MVHWQVFLLISILAESFGRVFQRFLLKDNKSDPIAYAVWFQFLTGILLSVYALIHGFKLPDNLLSLTPNLILVSVLYGLMSIFIFKALQQTEASIFTILFNSRVIITVLGAVILLNNPFTLKQVLGTVLILASVVAISFKKQKLQIKKGEIYSLLAGTFLALGVINDSIILKSFDVATFSAIAFIIPGIFIWLINPKSTGKILALPKDKFFPKIGLMGLIYGTAYLTYNFAYFSGQNAAQIAAIFPISSVITVLISMVLLKERQKMLIKLLAAIISFVGVLLVS